MQTLDLFQKIGAGAIVLACVVLLVRQFIGARRRSRLDASLARTGRKARWLSRTTRARALHLIRWPAAQRSARREADAAIRRARGEGDAQRPDPDRDRSAAKTRKLH